jgi:hypothetical protein
MSPENDVKITLLKDLIKRKELQIRQLESEIKRLEDVDNRQDPHDKSAA